jgi:hypothetical protein
MNKKKILISGHGPLNYRGIEKDYSVLWEDLWISTKLRPGRRFKAAPTMLSRDDLEGEIYFLDQPSTYEKYKEYKEYAEKEKEVYKNILSNVLNDSIYIDYIEDGGSKFPNIYTNKERINKKEAERMLSVYLDKALPTSKGKRRYKFVWKPTDIVIIPTGFVF